MKEIAAEGVLTKKEKSRERGSGWQTVAENLCPVFNIELSSRSVRDHYSMLSRKHKTRLAREERATGEGGEELTEKEALLEELMQIEEETEIQMGEEMVLRKQTAEMEKGLEMRERAMECYGETRKRVLEHLGKEKKPQKRRKSGEMFDWLNKRVEVEMENKEKERREQQQDREVWQQQLYIQQQQQQFSMLQQQIMAMMHQQQQQTQAMFELLRQGRE